MRSGLALAAAVVTGLTGCGGGGGAPQGAATTSTSPQGVTVTTSTTTDRNGNEVTVVHGHARAQPSGKAAFGTTPVGSAKLVLAMSQFPITVPCGIVTTRAFLRRAYGGVSGCAMSQRNGLASSLHVLSVRRNGDRATVKAVPRGGTSAGDTLTVSLVHAQAPRPYRHWGKIWRVSKLRSNVPVGP
jgi:hypothetical protein